MTWITNDQFEKFRLNVPRDEKGDVAHFTRGSSFKAFHVQVHKFKNQNGTLLKNK